MSSAKWVILLTFVTSPLVRYAQAVEVFAKGSYSKNYLDEIRWEERISGSTGIGFSIFKGFRIEGRYTYIHNLENQMLVTYKGTEYTLVNLKTQTVIYSVGVDIDLAGSRSPFQPFLFCGVGVLETASSYTVSKPSVEDFTERKRQRLSGNFGLGFRWALGKSMALELEAIGYVTDLDQSKPIINTHATAGIRLFI